MACNQTPWCNISNLVWPTFTLAHHTCIASIDLTIFLQMALHTMLRNHDITHWGMVWGETYGSTNWYHTATPAVWMIFVSYMMYYRIAHPHWVVPKLVHSKFASWSLSIDVFVRLIKINRLDPPNIWENCCMICINESMFLFGLSWAVK